MLMILVLALKETSSTLLLLPEPHHLKLPHSVYPNARRTDAVDFLRISVRGGGRVLGKFCSTVGD